MSLLLVPENESAKRLISAVAGPSGFHPIAGTVVVYFRIRMFRKPGFCLMPRYPTNSVCKADANICCWKTAAKKIDIPVRVA
jgi:hypothetical protein